MKLKLRLICFILCFTILSTCLWSTPLLANEVDTEFELAYRMIQNFQNGEPSKEVPHVGGFEDNRISALVSTVIPEKIYIASKWWVYSDGSTSDFVSYGFNMDKKSEIANQEGKKLSNSLINEGMSAAEKIQAFNNYMVLNVEYDHQAAQDGVDPNDVSPFSQSGIFLDKKAVCDGYTSAMMVLCNTAGILSFKVSSKKMNHAWNLIYDGTSWSFTDVTNNGNPQIGTLNGTLMVSPEELYSKDYYFDESGRDTLSLKEYIDFIMYYMNRKGITINRDNKIFFKAPKYQEKLASVLQDMMLLRGTEIGLELERFPRRSEMATMFTRVLGMENTALLQKHASPFEDIGWAGDYIGYLYHKNLIRGISDRLYGAELYTSINDYATVLLRALGYSEQNGDFKWASAGLKGKEYGFVTNKMYDKQAFGLSRGDMVEMTFLALFYTNRKGTNQTLCDYLIEKGALDQETVNAIVSEHNEYISQYFLNN